MGGGGDSAGLLAAALCKGRKSADETATTLREAVASKAMRGEATYDMRRLGEYAVMFKVVVVRGGC